MASKPTSSRNPDVHESDDGRARTWLKPEQIEQLRDVCLTDAVPTYLQDRNETIITLAYDAGLRASELCALDVDHLDLEAGTVYLPSAIQKGDPPAATLNLDRETVRLLRRYLRDRWKDTDALFPTRSSDRLSTRSLQRLINKLAIEADVKPQLADGGRGDSEDITPHTIRHSVAYRIIQVEGGRLEDVQLRLRHANRQTTDQIYSHLVPR
ncbi:tyrosine-type recombinase/integrase (plasmid) [Natrinema thermotolerans]|uniref:Tyrosine-type recombinase/integrase n=1 Tax=Natrinema thermotolerans TaxID=121872 RepID=A0AAF0T3G4_9EURY|nr:tyrosine-type recombinase/integrase [Natrinema thermotolerans]QCC57309.1 site-specific integrase [Natrinema thermotolerans]WMT10350.1 tyrosine-type recombinase/integrase [Natrinema thermotolerans]